MGYRKFVDRSGNAWSIRERSRWEWQFEPEGGNPGPARTVRAPGHQNDPFELSKEELQRLLDSAPGTGRTRAPNPFKD
jgi:hypothetical protein